MGVAMSDDLGMMAHPLETIAVKTCDAVARVAELARKHRAGTIVVGIPRNMDGTYGTSAEKARSLVDKLKTALPECTVRGWDERLTTVAAQKSLHEAGRNAKQSKSVIDQVAAQMILQGWLDSQSME